METGKSKRAHRIFWSLLVFLALLLSGLGLLAQGTLASPRPPLAADAWLVPVGITPTCPPGPGPANVIIEGFNFLPRSITVTVGSTVTWSNYDTPGIQHTSTSDTGVWDSGLLDHGQSFGFTFTSAGVYPYYCTLHPGMTGVVTVRPPCETATTTNTPQPTLTGTPTPVCPPATRQALMIDYLFMPQVITITQGSTVNWINEGPSVHTTTSDTGVWDSGNRSPGQTFQFTFGSPGTYPYHCTLHPGMTGTVVVTDCGFPTPTPTPVCPLQWRTLSSPNVSTYDSYLLEVDALSANDAWAVGYYFDGFGSRTLAEHWDGTQWSVIPSPNGVNGTGVLAGIAAVAANDVWAVGYSGVATLILHWNGTNWSVVSSPNIGTGMNGLNNIGVVAANDIWAVGSYYNGSAYRTLIEHWNGAFWSVVSSPNVGTASNFLWGGVSVVAANDVWAVGSYGPSSTGRTLILHWNGTNWSVVSSPNVGNSENRLIGVSAVSSNNVWAVGFYGPYLSEQTLVQHWDGTQWSIVASPNPLYRNQLLAVESLGPNDVWAVGFQGTGNTLATLTEHWDGTQWSAVSSPNQPGSYNYVESVSAASDSYIWAVGSYTLSNVQHTLTMRYSYAGTGCPTATVTRTPTHTPTMTPTPVCPPVTRQVLMIDFQFLPQTITVTEGSTVRWFNEGPTVHNSTSDTGVWSSGNLNPGQSFQFMFNTPGVYPYNCTLHPGMVGAVKVLTCATNTPTATPTPTPTHTVTPGPACSPPHYDLTIFDFMFTPSQIWVREGATVRWVNQGPSVHTTTSDEAAWDSGNLNPGQEFEITLNTPAVYHYHCTLHPQMTGTITVWVCPTTPTPTVIPRLVGHVNWEARPSQPNQLQVLPITLTLKSGATEINYPKQLTDQYGFFTVTVDGLPNGTYDWRVDDSATALHSPNYLANSGTVVLSPQSSVLIAPVEMGLMRAGDANDDNRVSVLDFNILKVAFGSGCGNPNYDNRADFTGDCLVNITDFNPLKANFGLPGAPPK